MRFRLTLRVEREKGTLLPLNYQYELSSWIYRLLNRSDSRFGAWLHESGYCGEGKNFKLFTFSHLQVPAFQVKGDRMDIRSERIGLVVSFYPMELAEPFVSGTFCGCSFVLGDRKSQIHFSVEAVERCRRAGFDNLSIDLIYGLPGETDERWRSDLSQAVALGVEHLSAYHLTYEEGTPLYRMLQEHRVSEVDEDSSVRFFTMLMDTLSAAGYEHYEISNFCKPGRYARHNTAYWQGIPYLGCGPSAHSFNRIEREWNVASLGEYLAGIESGNRRFEVECLDTETRYNEYIMTGLRTRWGVLPNHVQETFGVSLYRYLMEMAAPYLKDGKLELEDGSLRLTRAGIFVSDGIISDLMSVEN